MTNLVGLCWLGLLIFALWAIANAMDMLNDFNKEKDEYERRNG